MFSTDHQVAAEPRSRRRGSELEAAIQDAVRAELADRGYHGVTFEGVARRCRTSKPVLYRRYPSRAHMVADAMPSLRWRPPAAFPWTESLRADLVSLFTSGIDAFVATGVAAFRSLIGEADDELFAMLTRDFAELDESSIVPALERARARGDIGPRPLPRRAVTSIGALMRDELVYSSQVPDETTIGEIIDSVYLPLITALSFDSSADRASVTGAEADRVEAG